MTPLQIVQRYFNLSNKSDFNGIGLLMNDSTTYQSRTGEKFQGVESILTMQKNYHQSFKRLKWQVNSMTEKAPRNILIDFTFNGILLNGKQVIYSGLETIIVLNNHINHVEVKTKNHH